MRRLGELGLGLLLAAAPAAGVTYRLVASHATDTLRDPRLAEDGTVSYMRSGSVWALYREGLELVRVGSPAPWNSALTVTFLHPAAARYGGLLYRATVTGPGINAANSFFDVLDGSGALVVDQSATTPAPGTAAGITFNGATINSLRLASGRISMLAGLTGGDTECNPLDPDFDCEGIWSGTWGSLTLRARAHDQAPGFGVNHVLHDFSDSGNNFAPVTGGNLAFVADVLDTVGMATTKAIYVSPPIGALDLIARESDPVPGGGTLSGLQAPSISRHGYVVFGDTNGLYASQAIGFRVLARRFGPAPGGDTFSQLFHPATAGQAIAFKAELQAFSHDAILLETDTQAQFVLVEEGDAAPNTAPNVAGTFERVRTHPVVNGCGQVAFLGELVQGGGISAANDEGIWVYDALGNGELIVREGQSAAVFGFSPHTVSAVHFLDDGMLNERASLDDGGVAAFNDLSHVVFTLELSNGTDLIVVALPNTQCHRLFTDGFEWGDTGGWSTTVP